MHGLTWSELVELGAPKTEGQFLTSGPMSNFSIFLKQNMIFLNELDPLDYVKIWTALC